MSNCADMRDMVSVSCRESFLARSDHCLISG